MDKHKSEDSSALTIRGVVFAPIVKALAGDVSWAPETPPLAMVTEAYIALLDAWNKARAAGSLKDDMPQVLVLDEANVLMAWGDQYKAERQALLRFFVAITKARRRSHVILATSEYSFLSWLSKGKATGGHGQDTTGSTAALAALQQLCIYYQAYRLLVGLGMPEGLLVAGTNGVLVGHRLPISKLVLV